MLLIPLTGKISRRNLPIITLALILINTIIYFGFQWHDDDHTEAAYEYAETSGLLKMEARYYVADRQAAGRKPDHWPGPEALDSADERAQWEIMIAMYRDDAFMTRLDAEQVIVPGSPDYAAWRPMRDEFETRMSRAVSYRLGLRPAHPAPITFFTCMFLHGGFGHLLGNMIFLWLVGCMLEMGCGRVMFAATYLITGLCASGLFWAIYPTSVIPLVGASGAIAGLMGAFAVLYGRKHVKIFYSLGFYFNYRTVPAIWLLPFWIGQELYQLFFGGMSNVAYVAHIGGLAGGALIGFINRRFIHAYDPEALTPEPEDTVSPIIEKALAHIGRLEMTEGIRLLEQARSMDGGRLDVMTHLFNARRHEGDSPSCHDAARALLDRLLRDPDQQRTACQVYLDYTAAVGRPRLSVGMLLRTAAVLAAILKQKPGQPGLAAAMLKLAEGFRRKGAADRSAQWLQLVASRFPGSNEARMAAQARS